MELIEGQSFSSLMYNKKFKPNDALVITWCGLQGLHVWQNEVLEDLTFVHRDIKPDNFLIKVTETGRLIPVLLDPGIMKMDDRVAITGPSEVLGTPEYMAPENFRGSSRVNCRVDIFAFGIMLYEAITKELPLEIAQIRNDLSRDGLVKYLKDLPLVLAKMWTDPRIPAHIAKVGSKATAFDPDNRYQSYQEMQSAIAEALAKPAETHSHASLLPPEPSNCFDLKELAAGLE